MLKALVTLSTLTLAAGAACTTAQETFIVNNIGYLQPADAKIGGGYSDLVSGCGLLSFDTDPWASTSKSCTAECKTAFTTFNTTLTSTAWVSAGKTFASPTGFINDWKTNTAACASTNCNNADCLSVMANIGKYDLGVQKYGGN